MSEQSKISEESKALEGIGQYKYGFMTRNITFSSPSAV